MLIKKGLSVFIVLAIILAFGLIACDPGGGDDEEDEYGPLVDGIRYKIGDTGHGGGIVFYISHEGFNVEGYGPANYLEVAPEDQDDNGSFGTYGLGLSYSGTAIGTGKKNTAIIIAEDDSTAAKACVAYSTAYTNPGDWFLPSKDELNELYKFYVEVTNGKYPGLNPGFAEAYWTSSEYDNNDAWCHHFVINDQFEFPKDNFGNVRAIRAF